MITDILLGAILVTLLLICGALHTVCRNQVAQAKQQAIQLGKLIERKS